MGSSVVPTPSAASKTRYVVNLTSGTSWTVPTGVTYVNATLIGGGGGGDPQGSGTDNIAGQGLGGQIITTNVSTTPGASITYAIGAGGASNAAGGTTTFTGATSAVGGNGYSAATTGTTGTIGLVSNNGGGIGTFAGGAVTGGVGGAGLIELEYWL